MNNETKNGYYANYKNRNTFMPFGSLMNSYAQIFKPKDLTTFLTDAEKIFEKAKEMTGNLYLETQGEIKKPEPQPQKQLGEEPEYDT